MTAHSVEYIRAVAFDLNSPRPEIKAQAAIQAGEILNDLANAKQALNDKKKAYHAGKKKS